jgi:hypothetical protein
LTELASNPDGERDQISVGILNSSSIDARSEWLAPRLVRLTDGGSSEGGYVDNQSEDYKFTLPGGAVIRGGS